MLFTPSLSSRPPQDEYAATPLMAASDRNHIEVARFLVEHGASVNYQDKVFDNLICFLICLLYYRLIPSMATHLFTLHVTVATQIL